MFYGLWFLAPSQNTQHGGPGATFHPAPTLNLPCLVGPAKDISAQGNVELLTKTTQEKNRKEEKERAGGLSNSFRYSKLTIKEQMSCCFNTTFTKQLPWSNLRHRNIAERYFLCVQVVGTCSPSWMWPCRMWLIAATCWRRQRNRHWGKCWWRSEAASAASRRYCGPSWSVHTPGHSPAVSQATPPSDSVCVFVCACVRRKRCPCWGRSATCKPSPTTSTLWPLTPTSYLPPASRSAPPALPTQFHKAHNFI